MNFKTTYALFAAFLLVVSLVVLNNLFSGKKATSAETVFPSIKEGKVAESDITRLEIERAGPPAISKSILIARPYSLMFSRGGWLAAVLARPNWQLYTSGTRPHSRITLVNYFVRSIGWVWDGHTHHSNHRLSR